MHLHFEKNNNAKCDCNILSLSWMGKVPDELPKDEGWRLSRTNYYQEGWLATGNARGLVGVTFTTSHCRTRAAELPLRTNYNLRGHQSEVILVKWNEPYQKLASCDSSGVIFVWIKYDGRWSIELINDRSTPVTHFSWSHDGRMALICYRDGFVLVGSVAGQRYWSSMLDDGRTITCGIWTPDDQLVYFGTTEGQLIVMDVHGAMVWEVQLAAGVTSMAWSAEKFKMEEDDDDVSGSTAQQDERSYVLAVCLADGNIEMLRSFDDVSPITVKTGLKAPLHAEWSNSRKLLAVAGTQDSEAVQTNPQEYTNLLKFYSESGNLVYTTTIPYTQCQVSALTWGHNDRRLFVATGARVHAAWVSRRVGSLQLLSRLTVRAALARESSVQQLPLPPRLRALVAALFASTIRSCVPEPRELRRFVSRPPPGGGRLHCTMLRHAGEPAPCYTLYLEYLGGLVPLLKGRRTSKIRPEFVIFDPQSQDTLNVPEYTSQFPSLSDGSDTEKDTAELCGSPRNRRKNRRRRDEKPSNEESDDLAYVDTLPEHARLVEVTSNIWGTKFKIHGLADSVPANLGQVTYRTSLLHLQPRQMTLVMTELRDDLPAGPDPTFNPNLFSEDEEETFQEPQDGARMNSDAQQAPPVAPMTPRNARLTAANRPKSQTSNPFLPTESSLPPALARAESYEEEFPYVDFQDMVNFCENLRAATSNTYRTPPRHNAPRCCDVPALQSPKNAVAPTQTLIATSNPGADYAGNMQRVKTALADQQTSMTMRKELENNKINQNSDDKTNLASCPSSIIPTATQNGQSTVVGGGHAARSLPPSLIINGVNSSANNCSQSQQHYLNSPSPQGLMLQTCQTYVHPKSSMKPGVLSNLGSPSSNAGQTGSFAKNVLGSPSGPGSPTCSHQSPANSEQCHFGSTTTCSPGHCSNKRKETKTLGCCPTAGINHTNQVGVTSCKVDEMRYIDEENGRFETDFVGELRGVHRTPTVASIGPLCPSLDPIVRSCSVGYLDFVDVQMAPCDVALEMLRRETPNKRLVLVSRKTKKRRKNKASQENAGPQCAKPRLRTCGKSRSLDSSDVFPSNEHISLAPALPEHAEKVGGVDVAESPDDGTTEQEENEEVWETVKGGDTEESKELLDEARNELQKVPSDSPISALVWCIYTRVQRTLTNLWLQRLPCLADDELPLGYLPKLRKSASLLVIRWRVSALLSGHPPKTNSIRPPVFVPPFTVCFVEFSGSLASSLDGLAARLRDFDESHSLPPPSPRPTSRLPRSSPSSPAPSKKGKRPASASPIRRRLLSSPLLSRRARKSRGESSDDEGLVHDETSRSYRNLETFQKAQLRQKLKQRGIGTSGYKTEVTRRELVMHNKAPMWNESSQVYQLDFGGRVTQESAKNFQIEFRGKQVMQFGRIDGNAYTLDFQYPFSALQAFAVALANVTQRLKSVRNLEYEYTSTTVVR